MRWEYVLVAALCAAPSITADAGARLAQASPPAIAHQSTESIDANQEATAGADAVPFEDRVAQFVSQFYLSGETRTEADLERLYAGIVDYFNEGRVTRRRVIADKRAYFAHWPIRRYRLHRETLRAIRRPGVARIYDVIFEYDFDVASRSRTSRGRGRGELTLDLDQAGGRVTREGGIVLARWR